MKTGIENLKITSSSLNLKHIKRFVSRAAYDCDVFLKSKNRNLQREFVWSLEQKQALVCSFLREAPVGVVTIVQYTKKEDKSSVEAMNKSSVFGNDILKIIDGKQRLNALLEFSNNVFPIFVNDIGYFFDDMDDKLQSLLLNKYINVNILYDYEEDPELTDDDYIKLFLFLNHAGQTQSQEYLNELNSMVNNFIVK